MSPPLLPTALGAGDKKPWELVTCAFTSTAALFNLNSCQTGVCGVVLSCRASLARAPRISSALSDLPPVFPLLSCSGHSPTIPSPGRQALGYPEEPASYELRQIEPLTPILLRERHHAEGQGLGVQGQGGCALPWWSSG